MGIGSSRSEYFRTPLYAYGQNPKEINYRLRVSSTVYVVARYVINLTNSEKKYATSAYTSTATIADISKINPPRSIGEGKMPWKGYNTVRLMSYTHATNGVAGFAAKSSRIILTRRMSWISPKIKLISVRTTRDVYKYMIRNCIHVPLLKLLRE